MPLYPQCITNALATCWANAAQHSVRCAVTAGRRLYGQENLVSTVDEKAQARMQVRNVVPHDGGASVWLNIDAPSDRTFRLLYFVG
jgi:hypothetical protein